MGVLKAFAKAKRFTYVKEIIIIKVLGRAALSLIDGPLPTSLGICLSLPRIM